MSNLFTAWMIFFVAIAASAHAEETDCKKYDSLKPDIRSLFKHIGVCKYLGGEHTGGGSKQRDTQINQAMAKEGCGNLDRETLELTRDYWSSPKIARQILFAKDNPDLVAYGLDCK